VATAFDVLAQPHRRRILDLLLVAEHPVGELVEATALSQPTVSKHLRVLRDAGLVEVRVEAQRRVYRLRAEPLQSMDEWLAPYRRLWATSLDALERHRAGMDDGERAGRSGEQAGRSGEQAGRSGEQAGRSGEWAGRSGERGGRPGEWAGRSGERG
jgi:DNA-binding transcriptional ArsR family regulator